MGPDLCTLSHLPHVGLGVALAGSEERAAKRIAKAGRNYEGPHTPHKQKDPTVLQSDCGAEGNWESRNHAL